MPKRASHIVITSIVLLCQLSKVLPELHTLLFPVGTPSGWWLQEMLCVSRDSLITVNSLFLKEK